VGQVLAPEENMAREKKYRSTVRGGQLLAPGDIIQVMDEGTLVKCRVLSCLAVEGGGCLAGLEILEGKRKGERIQTTLRAAEEQPSDVDD
jgi:hypothetical protein